MYLRTTFEYLRRQEITPLLMFEIKLFSKLKLYTNKQACNIIVLFGNTVLANVILNNFSVSNILTAHQLVRILFRMPFLNKKLLLFFLQLYSYQG